MSRDEYTKLVEQVLATLVARPSKSPELPSNSEMIGILQRIHNTNRVDILEEMYFPSYKENPVNSQEFMEAYYYAQLQKEFFEEAAKTRLLVYFPRARERAAYAEKWYLTFRSLLYSHYEIDDWKFYEH